MAANVKTQIEFPRTSQGRDVYLNKKFIGTIVGCVFGGVFFRALGGMFAPHIPFETFEDAERELTASVDRVLEQLQKEQ